MHMEWPLFAALIFISLMKIDVEYHLNFKCYHLFFSFDHCSAYGLASHCGFNLYLSDENWCPSKYHCHCLFWCSQYLREENLASSQIFLDQLGKGPGIEFLRIRLLCHFLSGCHPLTGHLLRQNWIWKGRCNKFFRTSMSRLLFASSTEKSDLSTAWEFLFFATMGIKNFHTILHCSYKGDCFPFLLPTLWINWKQHKILGKSNMLISTFPESWLVVLNP